MKEEDYNKLEVGASVKYGPFSCLTFNGEEDHELTGTPHVLLSNGTGEQKRVYKDLFIKHGSSAKNELVKIKPIPQAVYPCRYCADEYSWPAADLFWSTIDKDWVCAQCWSDRDSHEGRSEDYGITLQQAINEMKKLDENGNQGG